METFSDDVLTILEQENLVREDDGVYRCTRPLVLVGYSMGTLVTSLLKKRIVDDDGGATTAIEEIFEDGYNTRTMEDITLFHISPVMTIKKRRLLYHFFLPDAGKVDLRFLRHPFAFFHLVREILSARRYIDLAGYIIT